MMLDKGQFLSKALTMREMKEIAEISHSGLLERAFKELSGELDINGNSECFQRLRESHARKLLGFWQRKRTQYLQAQREGRIEGLGRELTIGDEKLTISELGVYEDDEAQALLIQRRTSTEKDEVSITADPERGIDELMNPPTIKSEVTDPQEITDISYKVVLRQGRISTFERVLVRMDPQHQRPYIKDIRVIDCSIFGVELP